MNKHCYRMVFNKARGILMAVAEIAVSQGKASGETSGKSVVPGAVRGNAFRALTFSAWATLAVNIAGLVMWAAPAIGQGQIVADPNAPANQRPTVLVAPNGVPLVNIQTPSAAGVSRNTYRQFDVLQQGAILNNSRTDAQTQLGGWVQGNPWLATGSARVILNEVNSSNPSLLQGYVEVGGSRVQVVIANPAGVTCDGCGFINASRATLTTGTPILTGGNLDGYRVQGGVINITGAGLDTSTADYTDLIARAVQVNAGIWANQLKVTTGANQVDAEHTVATPIAGTGAAPAFAIDVAQLGGMYAGKITLVGTEIGVGVRNAGNIGASVGELIVTAEGRLENAGRITSASHTQIDTSAGIDNSGTIYAQGNASLGTRDNIDNSGVIAALGNTTLAATGTNSQIISTNSSVLGAGVQADGSIGNSGALSVNASKTLTAQGQNLSGGDQILVAQAINLSASQTSASDLHLSASQGDIDLTGATVAASQTLTANASQTLRTDQATLSAMQINASAHDLSNVQGEIVQVGSGDLTLNLPGNLDNTQGRIATNSQNCNLAAATLINTDGQLEHAGTGTFKIEAATLNGVRGQISSNGILDLNVASATLDSGYTIAQQLLIDSNTLSSRGGTLIQTGAGATTITASVQLDNTGGVIASNGATTLTVGDLDNHAGYIGSAAVLTIQSAAIDNTQGGLLTSAAQLNISGNSLDNQAGQIQASGDANISLSGTLNNTASLVRSGQALGIAAGSIVNANTQGAEQGLEGQSVSLNAQQINNQQGAVRADSTLTMTSHGSINNTQGLISSGETVILQDSNLAAKVLAITNTSGTVIAGQQLDIDSAGLTGDGKVLSQGDLSVKLTQNYTHTGELQANGSASLETTGTLTNQSTLLAGTALNLKAASIDNQANGQISANQVKLEATDSHTLTNRGLIDGQDTIIETATLNNLGTGRIYGDHVAIGATTVTNDVENGVAPVIAARDRLDIGATTITNREHALIFSAGDMVIGGSLDANKQATGQAATLNNNSATIEALGNMAISAANINNTNEHFSTQTVTVSTTAIDEHQGLNAANRYPHSDAYTANVRDSFYQWIIHGTSYFNSYEYIYNRTVTETQQLSSDPARILAGGGITLNVGQTYNDKSQIIAGGNIDVSGGSVTNTTVAGIRTTTDAGTALHYIDHQPGGGGNDWTEIQYSPYNPAPTVQAINVNPTVYLQNTASAGTGTQISALSSNSANQAPTGAHAVSVAINHGPDTGPIQVMTWNSGNVSVPNSSLFSPSSNPNSGYLIETDQRFANYRSWLSSDYLLNALAIDPVTTQKRLGDGFYEQKLIREQVAQLTGRRFLDGYASDEAQYQALMGNASTFAQAHQLRPGVALSAEQMAQLTSDIVWLVEKDITLANGQTTKALVPQVYVRVQDGDLASSGALISGASIAFNLSGDLTNAGTIAGRNVVALTAENVHNLGGRITGNDVGVAARTDLNNIGGQIDAANSLVALAGRDLNVISTTSTQTSGQGSRTNINRVAGLYVTGSNGTMIASAGRDLNLTAADIANGVPNAALAAGQPAGSTELVAGRNLNLGTVSEAQRHDLVWNPRNFRKENSRTDVGTTIQTTGDIRLQAGNDLNAKAANVTSDQGALMLTAGNDLNIVTGSANLQRDEASFSKSRGTWGSKSEVSTRDTTNKTTALGSTFSGDTVTAQAGHDLNVKGSNVVATNDVTLMAQNNVNIEAAANTLQESHFREEKRSGLFGSGGLGITIGSQKKSTDNKGVSAMATASTVGSTEGNVTIEAGKNYKQTGSDVLAPQGDIDINAQKIDIIEAQNTSINTTETKFKQSGITLALSNPVISAVQTAQHMAEAAGETKDARMQALAGATVALNAKSAYDAVQAGQGQTINGKDNQIVTGQDADGNPTSRDANAVDKVGGISVSISVGSSKSQSNSTQTSSTAQGSTVAAGNNVNLTATGAGKDSDLTVQGSQVTAGSNVTLKADDEINLLAAKSTAEQHSTNKSNSGSIGVSFGSQTGVTLAASQGRGNADGSDVSWTNTHVEAGNTLALQSGGDTTLKGAVASGKQVVADVGGNLNVESLQDTSSYESKQKSISGSVTIGASPSGSVSASKSKIDSSYASVIEQSGIKAGDEGFQVNVNGNTDLKGAVIASTQAAVDHGLNRFQTNGTLTTSDIQNQASYSAKSVGVNIGAGVSLDGKLAPSGSGAGMGKDNGDASSTTQSGISGIAGNTAVRTGDAETGIAKIFDADKVQKEINAQMQITQAFGQQASKAVGDYVQGQRNTLQEQLKNATTEDEKKTIQAQLSDITMQERVMNVLIGAVTGQGGTALTKETLSAGADQMRQIMIEDSKKSLGVVDADGNTLSNLSGISEGVRGDKAKIGGTRLDLDLLCGTDNSRCKTYTDESGKKQLDLNDKGEVQFVGSLRDFLATDEGKKLAGFTGGIQGWTGTLFGKPYTAGSWQDKLIEAFGGTHDMIGGKASGLYDEQGNIKRGMTGAERDGYEVWSAVAIAPSTPFAMAELLPPEVWKGISILLGAAK